LQRLILLPDPFIQLVQLPVALLGGCVHPAQAIPGDRITDWTGL
jgi:hypothetical protein